MRSLALLAAFAATLSGCSSTGAIFENPEANIGPCPSAFALHDAHRLVEFHGEDIVYDNVGFTGEITGVRTLCSYYGERPILANLEIDFGFGRGPSAQGREHNYQYFVAVTRRDIGVIHRETFPLNVRFGSEEDRQYLTETIDAISIPRADPDTSGANFEILVGFELTGEQLAYNRSGRRFRVAAGQD
ncbi:hypothetical protein [Maricaulis sp.]|uniref:hypothetical protein n=1 Tax=Maricaulis sp. TaxID=1486257 RepID=UPI0026256D74|nr:hypothetical protein [Maricaulis sp.]